MHAHAGTPERQWQQEPKASLSCCLTNAHLTAARVERYQEMKGTLCFKYLQMSSTDSRMITSTDLFTAYHLLPRAIAMPIPLLLRELVSEVCM
jgi:hypothetical protein